jgi:hypothetical protein
MFASTKLDWPYIISAKYVLISTMVHTAKLGYAIAGTVRANNQTSVIVFGGPHPTCEPEDTLRYCDFVVTNEGEETILELLERLEKGGPSDFSDIQGLAYQNEEGVVVYTARRASMKEIDFPLEPSLIHHYPGVFGNLVRTGMLRFPFPVVQFSRGCPYSCSFCLGARQLGRKYRTRTLSSVLEDLRRLHALTNFPYGMFHDNDVAIRKEETKELLRAMIAAKLDIRRLTVFTRIESTKDQELWSLFEQAGIANVIFGIESLNQGSLNAFNKSTTVEGIYAALDRLDRYRSSIKIVASFVVGDTADPLGEMALIRDFWRRFHRRIQRVAIQPLMEYPFQKKLRGQDQLYSDEQFIHYDWDYYSGDYLVFYPTACRPSVFQEALRETFRVVHSVPDGSRHDMNYRMIQSIIRYTHRGKDRNLGRYIEFLKRMERNKYGSDGRLIPETLLSDPKPWTVDVGAPTRRSVRLPGWVQNGRNLQLQTNP